VLLLNSVLTVEEGLAASHKRRGWEALSDAVVRVVADGTQPCVFMLWGAEAQAKAEFVDEARHLVLRAPHPSPLSAHRGFLGCRHFSRANAWLEARGETPIDWALPEAAGA
jgi:uracil-DNA glycosylase